MELGKLAMVQFATVIHFALTAIALFRLFKLKNVTGGFVILSILGLCVPILGPFALILIINKKKKEEEQEMKKKNTQFTSKNRKATKRK